MTRTIFGLDRLKTEPIDLEPGQDHRLLVQGDWVSEAAKIRLLVAWADEVHPHKEWFNLQLP